MEEHKRYTALATLIKKRTALAALEEVREKVIIRHLDKNVNIHLYTTDHSEV